MKLLVTLWWLGFWSAAGLTLGSFLNAVIYRVPRQRSLRSPLWSFCPHCGRRISWYDNLPLLSFLILKGRCRHCGVPIATSYLVVESAMAIIVLMLIDAFMIGAVRPGLSQSSVGLTERLILDWPMLVAHMVLFACLFAMSAIDLEHYWVDIRFTNFVTVTGILLHALWTPTYSAAWPRPDDATAVCASLALVGLAVVWLFTVAQREMAPLEQEQEIELSKSVEQPVAARHPPPSLISPSRAAGWMALLILAGLLVALVLREANDVPIKHTGRALVPLAFFFVLILMQSSVERDSDHAIVEAIHEERHGARGMVLKELLVLLPAIVLGGIGLGLMLGGGELTTRFSQILHTEVSVGGWVMFRHWEPLYGLATAISGFVIAGAIGCAIRIIFTLVFGKEAFGSGDIHLMAAAGCVAGWQVVLLGFFLTCGISLLGWLVTLPFKRTRALPLGPWLSLAILIIVVFYDPIATWPPIARIGDVVEWLIWQKSQAVPARIVP